MNKTENDFMQSWMKIYSRVVDDALVNEKIGDIRERPYPFIKAMEHGMNGIALPLFDDIAEACVSAIYRYCEGEGVKFPENHNLSKGFSGDLANEADVFMGRMDTMWDCLRCFNHNGILDTANYQSDLATCLYALHQDTVKRILDHAIRSILRDESVEGADKIDLDVNGEYLYHYIYEAEDKYPEDIAWAIDDDHVSDLHCVLAPNLLNYARGSVGLNIAS